MREAVCGDPELKNVVPLYFSVLFFRLFVAMMEFYSGRRCGRVACRSKQVPVQYYRYTQYSQ